MINAAAFTDVDRAETEQASAFTLNSDSPSWIASQTAQRGIPLIHISTDYVFDGRKGEPYVEQDKTGPLNAYGRSKLAGERSVAATNARHVILRTSWVYSPFRKNFMRTILKLAAERDHLNIVADQRGCPTAAADIAKACFEIAIHCAAGPKNAHYGTYHYAGGGEATWFEFANAILEGASGLPRKPTIAAIRTSEYPTPALRAADTRLDCSHIAHDYKIISRPWRQALTETMLRLFSKGIS